MPKSVSAGRIKSNLQVVDLDEEDMKTLNDLHKETPKRFIKPEWGVDLKFETW